MKKVYYCLFLFKPYAERGKRYQFIAESNSIDFLTNLVKSNIGDTTREYEEYLRKMTWDIVVDDYLLDCYFEIIITTETEDNVTTKAFSRHYIS